jgi:thiol-disulfide isomerase/thioredoxin
MMSRYAPLVLGIFVVTAAMASPAVAQRHAPHSELSLVGDDAPRCDHNVPADVCTRCNPDLEAMFRDAGDWCRGHRIPESQCWRCHPNLSFEPMPPEPEGADVAELTEDEALEGLEQHAVAGKVTVFDFAADWCVPCRNLDRHLRVMLVDQTDVAVRRIDVSAWRGPLMTRYLSHVTELPYVIVYDAAGARIGDLDGFEPAEIDALIDRARGE